MFFRWYIPLSPPLRSLHALSTYKGVSIATRRTFTNRGQHPRIVSPPLHYRLHTRPWTWRTLWVVPIIGGVAAYLSPGPRLHLPSVFSSPTLIPCPERRDNARRFTEQDMIGSPAEPQHSLCYRIIGILKDYVWEPILTARRFIYLFYLFVPVIITIPMLLVGSPDVQLQGDRWGAVWWYDYLVKRMQAAGPTFTKVINIHSVRIFFHQSYLARPMGRISGRSFPVFALRQIGNNTFARNTSYASIHEGGYRKSLPETIPRCI